MNSNQTQRPKSPMESLREAHLTGYRIRLWHEAMTGLYDACEWLTNLNRGIGKDGSKPEPSEWAEAFGSAEEALTKARGDT